MRTQTNLDAEENTSVGKRGGKNERGGEKIRSQSVSETIHEGGCARSVCAALIPTNYTDLISPHYKGSRWPLLMPLGDCLPSSKTSPKLAAAERTGPVEPTTPRRGEELVWKVVRNAARRLLPSGKRCALLSSEGAQRFFGAGLVESVCACARARGSVCVSRVSTTFRPPPPPFFLCIKRRPLRTGRGRRRQGRLARSLEKKKHKIIGLSHIRA